MASFTLGSTEISPLTLANAYATVAAHGVYCKPRVITKIVDRDGKELSVPAPKCKQAISRNVADGAAAVLTNVVDGNISGRTGAPMSLGRDTIGKTGTIDSNAAVWFAGSTPDLGCRGVGRRPPWRLPVPPAEPDDQRPVLPARSSAPRFPDPRGRRRCWEP